MRPHVCLWSVSRCPWVGAGLNGPPPLSSMHPTCAKHAESILRRHADGGALFATTGRSFCQGGAIRPASAKRRRPCPHRREVREKKARLRKSNPSRHGRSTGQIRKNSWSSQCHRNVTSFWQQGRKLIMHKPSCQSAEG